VLIGLTVYFLLKSVRTLTDNESDLERDFHLPGLAFTGQAEAKEDRVDPRALWRNYLEDQHRRWPVVVIVGICCALGFTILVAFGMPFVPFRGVTARVTGTILGYTAALALLVLTIYVLYSSRNCAQFIRRLGRKRSYWPQEAVRDRLLKRDFYAGVEEWMDIRFIARRTEALDPLILYPFLALTLHILAHTTYFDDWRMTGSMFLIFGPIAGLAVASVLILRGFAFRARNRCMERLRRLQLHAVGEDEPASKRVDAIMQAIESEDAGVFRPLSRHPVFGALLMPFSGVSVLALVDLLAHL
jgi:hypothetical protein